MANITRTIYASALQAAELLGGSYTIPASTTLNEKFNVLPQAAIPVGEYPVAKYIAIGRGGHKNVTGADNSSLTALETHRPGDSSLFKHIPFILREDGFDLTDAERSKYGLRVEEIHNGTKYIAYYLKRIDTASIEPKLQKVTITNGVVTTVPFIPGSSNIDPVPTEITPVGVTSTNGEYLTASAIITVDLSAADVQEIIDAAKIIHDSELYAVISEVALCTGYDKVTTVTPDAAPAFNYTEAIGVQVNTHVCTHYPIHLLNEGLTLTYEIGGSESLTL